MNKDKLMKSIMELDFMAVDLHLYLDTHPEDMATMIKYNELLCDIELLKQEYAKLYGPLNPFGKGQPKENHWLKEPWVYENQMLNTMEWEDEVNVDL